MVYLFFLFFFLFFHLTSKCTTTFTYIVFLNYLDTNAILFLIFVLTLYRISGNILFIFTQNFFIISSFYQLPFFKGIIAQLVVGTVLVHPIMFYFFLLFVLLKFYLRQQVMFLYQLSLTLSSIVFFLCTTLVLGGFWATQSSSWGYFWVNDLVEWSLLLIILTVTIYLHTWNVVCIGYNICFLSVFLLSLILAIRFGFFSTRHNFISTVFLTYNIYYFYLHLFFIFNKSVKSLHQVKFHTVLFSFFFFIISSVIIFFFKLICFIYFLFYWTRLILFRKFLYFHFLLFLWLCLWANPFVFFFLIHNFGFHETVNFGLLFSNFFSFNIFYYNFIESLSFTTFLFSFFKYFTMTLFKINGFVILNNFQLLYLLFIVAFFFVRKTGWI